MQISFFQYFRPITDKAQNMQFSAISIFLTKPLELLAL